MKYSVYDQQHTALVFFDSVCVCVYIFYEQSVNV